jgi:cysteine desulfurase
MFANNETGVLQPVKEAADIAHEKGGLLFTDAAQAAGKVPVNFVMCGADLMAVTAHKFGGPIGVGALIAGPNLPLEPVMKGGGHESNRRAGTHNVPAIAGLGVACDLAPACIAKAPAIAALRDRMQAAAEAAGAVIWGEKAPRLPGTLSLSAPGFSSQTQLMAMDLAGIAISSGSACSSGKTKPSHVLSAMGADEALASCGIRVSVGWNSTEEDADAFIREWPAAYARIKARAA